MSVMKYDFDPYTFNSESHIAITNDSGQVIDDRQGVAVYKVEATDDFVDYQDLGIYLPEDVDQLELGDKTDTLQPSQFDDVGAAFIFAELWNKKPELDYSSLLCRVAIDGINKSLSIPSVKTFEKIRDEFKDSGAHRLPIKKVSSTLYTPGQFADAISGEAENDAFVPVSSNRFMYAHDITDHGLSLAAIPAEDMVFFSQLAKDRPIIEVGETKDIIATVLCRTIDNNTGANGERVFKDASDLINSVLGELNRLILPTATKKLVLNYVAQTLSDLGVSAQIKHEWITLDIEGDNQISKRAISIGQKVLSTLQNLHQNGFLNDLRTIS